MSKCSNPECDHYPYYGCAPHKCFYKIGKSVGQSEILDKAEWPENFVEDREGLADGEIAQYACGAFFCPVCLAGKGEITKCAS